MMQNSTTRFYSPFRGALWCAMLLGLAPSAWAEQDILKPEQAFRYEVAVDQNEVLVRWQIEPGHYLYKGRMAYASLSDDIVLGEALMPDGKPYQDEFFGRMEIYRKQVEIRLPILERLANARHLRLELRSQGCADIGLCYPPQVWTTDVALPEPGNGGKLQNLLRRQAGNPRLDDPLPPEIAFRPDVTVLDPFNLQVSWMIEEGYYLYRDSLKVTTSGDAAQIGSPLIPAGVSKWDEHFGETEVFYQEAVMQIPVSRASPDATELPLTVEYQGCKEDSICYPPQSLSIGIQLPAASASDAPRKLQIGEEMVSEQDRLSDLIIGGNLLAVLATFTGLGLLLAFTPCVLPMVPILSGIIAGQGKDVTTGRAFALSLTYVLGMAFTYTLAGAGFAAAGQQIQAALQQTWIIVLVAALFAALALSMFGIYELQMPAFIQNRLTAAGNRQKAGTFYGTAIMGALSALIVTTCVAPPLVASLTVIGTAGDIGRGALSLFALSIGMGIPLLVIGTSAGRLIPKAGAWMDAVKGAFGFMMLGLAIWMLERILPGVFTMLLWAALAVTAGVWMGAFERLEAPVSIQRKLGKGFGLLAALYGAALLIGALSGAQNPLQPLQFGGISSSQTGIEFKRIKTTADLDRELAAAATAGQPVMLDFYADWCVSCKEMEHYTFTDPKVKNAVTSVLLLQADVTANDAADKALLQRFGIFGPPTIVFFDTDGTERTNYRVVGFMSAEKFANHVRRAFGITS
jgi:thiol:disulfide interchange protein DsbD